MIDDAMNQKKTSDKSERDQELENNQCTPKVIKKRNSNKSIHLWVYHVPSPLILSSMSCDYVAGWRSVRSRWLKQRGAGE